MRNIVIIMVITLLLAGCNQSYKHIVSSDKSELVLDEDGNLTQCMYDGIKYSLGAVVRQDDRKFYQCDNTNPTYQDQVKNAYWKVLEKD